MLPTGSRETQNCESNNQRVHPQPMEEATILNQENPEALVSKIFNNISSLKIAYIQLQAAHTPYDPDKIEAADKLVISELKNLSELKHLYRENNPKPISDSLQDSHLVAEIKELQNLLHIYEVMVKKYQTQLQTKDSEIMQQLKLEKKLKLLSDKSSVDLEDKNECFSMELTTDIFTSFAEASYKAIREFSKPLVNLMKCAGWDLDAAANSIEPSVVYARNPHKIHAFISLFCRRMFSGFQEESFSVKSENLVVTKEGFFHQFLAIREMDPLDILSQSRHSIFGKFCRTKYLAVVHPKMEASFFGNLDQRNQVVSGGHPKTPFYHTFLKLAKSIWLLHRLAYSFDPKVKVFKVKRGDEFSDVYMESVVKNVILEEGDENPKVGLMVMPGFWIGGSVIQCRVYLSGAKCID